MNEAPAPSTAPLSLWQNRAFKLLFGAQLISLLGSGMTTVGLALFAYQFTGGASVTAVIGNALMLRILAFLLFTQPAGVIADRVSRKQILIAADLLRFGLLALFPFITAVWQIYALIFAINAVTAFFTPTFEAGIPEIVGNERYVQALSISRVAVDVEAVAAPALAGLLVALVGLRWVFWFDALTYLVSALLVGLAAVPPVANSEKPLSLRVFLAEITHGTRVLLREPSLRQALTLSFAEATAGAAAIVVTVAYVHEVLRRTETAYTLVMAVLGLGSMLTALLLSRASRKYERDVHRSRRASRTPPSVGGARYDLRRPAARLDSAAGLARTELDRLWAALAAQWRGAGADCDSIFNATRRTLFCGRTRQSLCRTLRTDACLLAHHLSGGRTRGGAVGSAIDIHCRWHHVFAGYVGGDVCWRGQIQRPHIRVMERLLPELSIASRPRCASPNHAMNEFIHLRRRFVFAVVQPPVHQGKHGSRQCVRECSPLR